MRYSETLQLFDQAFEFPTDHETVVEQLGDVELAAPTGDVVTVSTILDRIEVDTYQSSDDLYTTLLGGLEDGFIGRKYYDDRGGHPSGADRVRGEETEAR